MRRLLIATALTLVAAAAVAAAAAGKEMNVSLAAGPPGLGPGEPWNAELLVHGEPELLAEAGPGVRIRNAASGEERTYTAKATGKRARDGQFLYRARVVFPSDGRWSYSVIDGVSAREYHGGIAEVGDPAATPSTPATRPNPAPDPAPSLPAWAVILAEAAFLGVALVVARSIRLSRLEPSR